MAIAFHLDTSGFEDLGVAFGEMSQATDDALVATMTEVAAFLERQTVLGTPRDTGILAGGMISGAVVSAPHMISAFVGAQGPAAAYVLPVEAGARPHWPPRAPLEAWVVRKQLAWTDKKGRRLSVKSMAYLIARKIATSGTKPIHMAEQAVERGFDQVNAIVDRHLHEFIDRYLGGKG